MGCSALAIGAIPSGLARGPAAPRGIRSCSDLSRGQPPLFRERAPTLRLYPAESLTRTGNIRFGPAELDVMLPFFGDGEVVWELPAPSPGAYQVAACYSTTGADTEVEIACGPSVVRDIAGATHGFFLPDPAGPSRNPRGPEDPSFWSERAFYNFERVPLPGTLQLERGVNVIKLRVRGARGGELFRLRSVELTPSSETMAVQRSRELAQKYRSSTDWFVKAGYGIWFTFLDLTTPRRGLPRHYAQAVEDLDVEALASRVEEMGAGYLIFSTNHGDPTCPAPIKSWEAIHPGWTTRRDLIADLSGALDKRGIRLMLYMNCPGLGDLVQLPGTAVDRPTYSQRDYAEILERVLREFSLRYRERVAGYWFDSWFQTSEAYPDLPFERLNRAIKAGNPDCLVAYNYWAFPVETDWQDYWAGELTTLPLERFGSRYISRGAGRGLQAHSAIRLDSDWFHISPNMPIGPPLYSAEQLGAYIKSCMQDQAVVSIGIAIYQDGTTAETSQQLMREVRRIVRGV
jgi:hypothetical protein